MIQNQNMRGSFKLKLKEGPRPDDTPSPPIDLNNSLVQKKWNPLESGFDPIFDSKCSNGDLSQRQSEKNYTTNKVLSSGSKFLTEKKNPFPMDSPRASPNNLTIQELPANEISVKRNIKVSPIKVFAHRDHNTTSQFQTNPITFPNPDPKNSTKYNTENSPFIIRSKKDVGFDRKPMLKKSTSMQAKNKLRDTLELARSPSTILEGEPLADASVINTSIDDGITKNLRPRGLVCAGIVKNTSVPRNLRANNVGDTAAMAQEYFPQGSEGLMVDEKPTNHYHFKLKSDPRRLGPARSVNKSNPSKVLQFVKTNKGLWAKSHASLHKNPSMLTLEKLKSNPYENPPAESGPMNLDETMVARNYFMRDVKKSLVHNKEDNSK
jgi:hypothetical protein